MRLQIPQETHTSKDEKDTTGEPSSTNESTEIKTSSGTMAQKRPQSAPDRRLALFKEYRARDIRRQTTIDWSKLVDITDGFGGRDI